MRNLYLLMEVSLNATPQDLKSAYRRLARDLHPDNSKTGDAGRFKVMHEAHEILSNERLRNEYDSQRAQWVKQIGAILCVPCGSANVIKRRPRAHETVVCAQCKKPLPIDMDSAINLQKARLVSQAAKLVDTVGSEVADAAADILKAQINKLRMRMTGR